MDRTFAVVLVVVTVAAIFLVTLPAPAPAPTLARVGQAAPPAVGFPIQVVFQYTTARFRWATSTIQGLPQSLP